MAGRRTSTYDFVIVGGGSAGCALANRLSADPGTSVLVLEAGRSDFRIDPFIHMPAALPYPDRQPALRLEVRVRARAVHGRPARSTTPAARCSAARSSINGMIFQRGNPLDYERWAADPGMETWDYAHCLPYFKRMETCLAGADEWRGGSGPLVLERGPGDQPAVRRVLRGRAAGRLPAHRRRQRLPPGGLRARSTATCTAAAGSAPPAPTCTR